MVLGRGSSSPNMFRWLMLGGFLTALRLYRSEMMHLKGRVEMQEAPMNISSVLSQVGSSEVLVDSKLGSSLDISDSLGRVTDEGRTISTGTLQGINYTSYWRIGVPGPIIDLTLPKSGTSSVSAYFNCLGNSLAVHTHGNGQRLGACMRDNRNQERPALHQCGGGAVVYTDIGMVHKRQTCYYPQIDGLDEIFKWYPNATLLLVTRNATAWYHSMQNWHRGAILYRWMNWCRNEISLIPSQRTLENFVDFYHNHTQRVRSFAKQHPSMTYVELDMDDPQVGRYLEERIGIPAACWRQCRPGRVRDPGYDEQGCRSLPGMEGKYDALSLSKSERRSFFG